MNFREGVFLLVLATLLGISWGKAEELPPNILLITADNLGYGDLRCYREESPIPTPNLNRLAEEGARLTSFYTASPTCTVSRACLLTGRIPERHGLTKQLPGIEGNWGIGLPHGEKLIPEFLKAAPVPYATGCFGKWNIGFAEGSRPTERGFDEFFGHASGNINYYTHNYNGKEDLYRGTEPVNRQGEYATDLFADAAIDFVKRKSAAGQPWFCYLPFNAPHFPNPRNRPQGQPNEWQAPDRAFGAVGLSPDEKDPAKRYRAVVWALDEAIGRVLAALEKSGQAERTFVFFFSDNGAFRLNREGLDVGSNEPLRSGGVTCWEGGLRVVAMARWPGKIAPGSVIEAPLWSPDVLQAAVAISGAELTEKKEGRVFDGKNPLPVLTGTMAESPHRSFFFQYQKHAALRMGDWKIVRERPEDQWQLFNLAADLSERRDLAGEEPEVVEKLSSVFGGWRLGNHYWRSFRNYGVRFPAPSLNLKLVQGSSVSIRGLEIGAASFQEAFDQVRSAHQKLDSRGFSLIVGDPESEVYRRPIRLEKKDRSFAEAIDEICGRSGLRWEVEGGKIVVYPKED